MNGQTLRELKLSLVVYSVVFTCFSSVINGDLVTGEGSFFFFILHGTHTTHSDTFRENVTRLLDQIVAPFDRARTPFAVTLGV